MSVTHDARWSAGWRRLTLVLALVALALVGCGGDGEPTVTFDGEQATYSGATSFEPGDVVFNYDATGYDQEVAFVLARHGEDVTMEDLEAAAAENPASGPVPAFIANFWVEFVSDEVVEETHTLETGSYSLWVNTAPTDTDRAHPAVIIEVTGS